MHRDFITGQNLDKVHPELAGNMRQNGVPAADINGEHRIRQCIGNDALKFDYVVFRSQVINLLGCSLASPGLKRPGLFVIRR